MRMMNPMKMITRKTTFFTLNIFRFTLLISSIVISVNTQDFPLPPPTFNVDRHWSIHEDEPIGTKVAQARSSEIHETLEFSIEPSNFMDGSKLFKINSMTGAIYLNESLQGKAGKQFYVDVLAFNGHMSAKQTIWVEIVGSNTVGQTRPIPPGKPKAPARPFFPGLYSHDGRPIVNAPIFPPGLRPPSNAVIPPIPYGPKTEESSPPSTTGTTQAATVTTTSPENSKPTTNKPKYPPHLTNSNKNNAYEIDVINRETVVSTVKSTQPLEPIVSNKLENGSEVATKQAVTSNENLDEDSDPNHIILFTVVPIVLIFGVIPIAVASVWLVRRRSRVKKRPTKEIRKDSAAMTNSTMTTMSSDGMSSLKLWIKQAQSNRYESWNPDGLADPKSINRWEFPRHHLQVGRILGEGCFGQVWQCEALNIDGHEGVTTVAVKTLKEGAGERERADLISELAVMKMLEPHPHVVRLLGACTEKDPIFLIMEYVALGKLQTFLRNSRSSHYYPNLHADSNSLSSKDLTAFCYQVARGMEYLSSKGIIHRDLAARNILLDKEKVCKVADFGFARDVVANHVYERKTDGRLPVRWMAPEALYDNIFTTKTDIWSFGVLMWEVVTLGSTPYPGMSASEVMRKVREGYRLEKPNHCRRELYNIIYYCWAQKPVDRPTFADLVNLLKHLLFSETDYIELDRFPDHDYYNYLTNQNSGERL